MSLLVGVLALPSLLVACGVLAADGCRRLGVTLSQRFSPESVETGIVKVKTALKTANFADESNLAHFMSLEVPTGRWHRLGTSGHFLK